MLVMVEAREAISWIAYWFELPGDPSFCTALDASFSATAENHIIIFRSPHSSRYMQCLHNRKTYPSKSLTMAQIILFWAEINQEAYCAGILTAGSSGRFGLG